MNLGIKQFPSVKATLTLIFTLLLLQQEVSSQTTNNINICKSATVTVSSSSFPERVNDGVIASGHFCDATNCAHIEADVNNLFWVTVDFGSVVSLSTIVFLSDINENTDDFAFMTRTYGTSPSAIDFVANTEISQGATRYPFMIGDINNGGPAQAQYIHWVGSAQFWVSEIMCYEKKRLYRDDFYSPVQPYFQAQNGYIDTVNPQEEQMANVTNQYNEGETIWRSIIITSAGSLSSNTEIIDFKMTDGVTTAACAFDQDEFGYDCFDQAYPHYYMTMTVAIVPSIKILSIIILEDTDSTVSCAPQTLAEQISPTVYWYTIGDPTLTIPMPTVQTADCSEQCSVQDNNPGYAWWTKPANFEVWTNDITVLSTVTDEVEKFGDISIQAESKGSCSDSLLLEINLVNPCQAAATRTFIEDHAFTDQTVILDDASSVGYFVGDFTDTVSQEYGNQDGTTFCGARSFTVTEPQLVTAVGDTWQIRALTADSYTAVSTVPITVIVNVAYANTADVARFFTFNVIILAKGCSSTVISISTGSVADMDVLVGSGNQNNQQFELANTAAVQDGNSDHCGQYTCDLFQTDSSSLTWHMSNLLSLDAATNTVSLSNANAQSGDVGTYQLTLVCSLIDYSSSALVFTNDFYLRVHKLVAQVADHHAIIDGLEYRYDGSGLLTSDTLVPSDFTMTAISSTMTTTLDWQATGNTATTIDFQVFGTAALDDKGDHVVFLDVWGTGALSSQSVRVEFNLSFYDTLFPPLQDKIYILNGELVTHSVYPLQLDPVNDSTFSYTATIANNVYPAGTSLDSAWINYFENSQVVKIQSSDELFIDSYTLIIEAECNGGSALELIGLSFTTQYALEVHGHEGQNEGLDQTYLLDGSTLTFSLNPLVLNPVDASLALDYMSYEVGLNYLDAAWITFDDQTLVFTVTSVDLTIVGTYSIAVESTSLDLRWSDQKITTTFSVQIAHPCEATVISNFPGTINNMDVLVGSSNAENQQFTLENTEAISNGSQDYCGQYFCALSQTNGDQMTGYMNSLLSVDADTGSVILWNGEASSIDKDYYRLELECGLVSYPMIVSNALFDLEIHEVTVIVVDHHALIDGTQYSYEGVAVVDSTQFTPSDFTSSSYSTTMTSALSLDTVSMNSTTWNFLISGTAVADDKGENLILLQFLGTGALITQQMQFQFRITFYEYLFPDEPDKIYILNDEEVTHTLTAMQLDPCEDTDNGSTDSTGDGCAEYASQTHWCSNYDDDDFFSNTMCCVCNGGSATFSYTITMESSMLPPGSPLDPDWIIQSNLALIIQSDDELIKGDYTLTIKATITGGKALDLIGSEFTKQFDLVVHSYVGFEFEDQVYLMNGDILQFEGSQIVVDPFDELLNFDETAVRQGENSLPTSWINFDGLNSQFTIQFSGGLTTVHTFEVRAFSDDSRWSGQTIRTTFTVTTYDMQNTPPVFTNLDFSSEFMFNTASGNDQYLIELGPISNQEDDAYFIEFDDQGNDFITLDEALMILSIDTQTEPGTYTCIISLIDEVISVLNSVYTISVTIYEETFEGTVEAAENKPPTFDNLDSTNNFTFLLTDGEAQHVIELGPITDPQGDTYSIEFDAQGNNFITLEKTLMTLSIYQQDEPGIYTCSIILTDENDMPLSSEYKFVITINEGFEGFITETEQSSLTDSVPPTTRIESEDDILFIQIDGIDILGRMTVRFSKEMEIPRDLTSIDDSVLSLRIESEDKNNLDYRGFSWNVTEFYPLNCTIQLNWDNPPWVSSTTVRDRVIFKVVDLEKLVDPNRRRSLETKETYGVFIKGDGEQNIMVPPQAYPGDLTDNLAQTTEAAGNFVKSYMIVNVILQPILLFSLSMLWGLINGLQIIAYLMLFNISIPANVLIVDTVFYEIATFDIIPLEWVLEFLDHTFGDLDNNRYVYLSSNALDNDFDRTNPFHNAVVPLFLTIASLLVMSLLKLLSLCKGKLLQFYLWVKKKVYWNFFLRLLTEEYIVIALASLVKIFAFDLTNNYEIVSSTFALLMLFFTLLFPLLITRFLWRKHKENVIVIQDSSFKDKWGALTLDLQLKDRKAMLFILFFMFRRLLIAFTIVALPYWNICQVQFMLVLNLVMIGYQGWFDPYLLRIHNIKDLMNEVCIQLSTYFLIMYTDLVNDRNIRYSLGWINIGIFSFMILFNFLILLGLQGKATIRCLKLRYMKQQYETSARRSKIFQPQYSRYLVEDTDQPVPQVPLRVRHSLLLPSPPAGGLVMMKDSTKITKSLTLKKKHTQLQNHSLDTIDQVGPLTQLSENSEKEQNVPAELAGAKAQFCGTKIEEIAEAQMADELDSDTSLLEQLEAIRQKEMKVGEPQLIENSINLEQIWREGFDTQKKENREKTAERGKETETKPQWMNAMISQHQTQTNQPREEKPYEDLKLQNTTLQVASKGFKLNLRRTDNYEI